VRFAEFPAQRDNTHGRHIYVEHDDIRLLFDHSFNRFLAVAGITAKLETMPIKQSADSIPRRQIVIDHENFGWHASPLPAMRAGRDCRSAGRLLSTDVRVCSIEEIPESPAEDWRNLRNAQDG